MPGKPLNESTDASSVPHMAVRHWLKRTWQRRLLRLPRRGEGTRISGRARIEEPQNVFLGRGLPHRRPRVSLRPG